MLKLKHSLGIEEVWWARAAPLVFAAGVEHFVRIGCDVNRIRTRVARENLIVNYLDADATKLTCGAREVCVYELLAQTNRFEYLRTRIRRNGRDAHLRHDLEHALAKTVDQVLCALLKAYANKCSRANHLLGGLHYEIRVNSGCSVSD